MVNFEYDDSKSYVINVLGKPYGKKLDGEYETIRYTNKRISTWSNDNVDYNFVFKNGKLVEFGTSNVRSNKRRLFRYDGKFIFSVGKNGPWQ